MSFNSNYTEKYVDYRVELCSVLRPQPFLNELQSKTVLTREDREEILNETRNPTTNTKMGVMLDILKTKGPRGYNIFVSILGRVNPELYETMTGQKPPIISDSVQPIDYCNCTCHWSNIDDLTKLTEALKREEQLRGEVKKLAYTNNKLVKQNKEQHNKLKNLWTQHEVERDKNQDRNRLEEERNEMMAQLTNVTGKALNYKEELEVANNNLRQIRLEHLRVNKELAQVKKSLRHHRQKSMQSERSVSMSKTLIKNKEALEEKVAKLELELCKVDRADSNRISLIQGPSLQNDEGCSYGDGIQAALDIMRSDRDEAIRKGEDAVSGMYKTQKELHTVVEKLNYAMEEKEDLLMSLETQRDETEMQKTFAALAGEQLTRAVLERTQALEEKNIQTVKCARLMLERDKLTEQQRKLRAEMTGLQEKASSTQLELNKCKRKLRKLRGKPKEADQEDESDSSTDSDFFGFHAVLNITDPQSVNENGATKDQVEEFPPMTKRDSNTTDESNNHMQIVSSLDSEDDQRLIRERTTHIQYDDTKLHPRRKKSNTRESLNAFPGFEYTCEQTDMANSGTSSTEDENATGGHQWDRFQNESTKVHCDGNSIRRANVLLRTTTKPVTRRPKRKDRKNGMRPRSKSFNDLTNFSLLEDEIGMDLEFDLAFQDQSTRRRSSRLVSWFTALKQFQRQERTSDDKRQRRAFYV